MGTQSYSASYIKALECGKSSNATALTEKYDEAFAKANPCDLDYVASPDNVAMMPEWNQLLIGEDTSSHQNDMLWVRDFGTGKLTRIATTPYGSETTSPYWYPDVKGDAYITYVVQHPYGESDKDMVHTYTHAYML